MKRARISWRVRKTADGSYEGFIALPVSMAQIRYALRSGGRKPPKGALVPKRKLALKAKGESRADALERAASVADKIVSNPLIRDILPPGTNTAVAAVKTLAKAANVGKLTEAVTKFAGPGIKRIASALKFW